jgi:hypothetical protein
MKFEFLTANHEDCPADQQPTYFGFSCPKRDFMCTGLLLRDNPEGRNPPNRAWAWNGDREKPTFSPSINCVQSQLWLARTGSARLAVACSHGYITDGVWRDA